MAEQIKTDMNNILTLLRNALHIGKYAEMRSRYASTDQWKDEGPHLRKQAYIAWLLAKQAIGDQRPELEQYLRTNKDSLPQGDVDNFIAAIQVIDKELETVFEQDVLKEENMGRVKASQIDELENELEEREYDEDEEYLREQEALDERDLWDGDDYLGDVSDEEDEFFDDEE